MLKKSIALLLTALMVLSCVTPAFALTLEDLPLVIIAQETFSDDDYSINPLEIDGYSAMNKNIVSSYVYQDTTPAVVKITGDGWKNNWSISSTEYVEPGVNDDRTTDDKILYYRRSLYETSSSTSYINDNVIKLNSGNTTPVYRQLKEPLVIGGVDATYSFSFDFMHVNSGATARKNFAFDLGGILGFGFNNDTTGVDTSGNTNAPSYSVPFISVDGNVVKQAADKLTVGGGESSGYGEFVTYTLTLDINADGTDTAVLTAQDRQTYQSKNAFANTVSTDVVTVTYEGDISGTIEYVGLGSTAGLIDNIIIKGTHVPETADYDTSLISIASDEYGAGGAYASWTTDAAISGQFNTVDGSTDNKLAGTGFATNWSSSPDGTTALDDKVVAGKVTAGTTYGETINFIKNGATVPMYRSLKTPIPTKGKDGIYNFSFSVAEMNGSYTARSGVKYGIGENLAVGYEWGTQLTTEAPIGGEVTPFIEYYGERFYAEDKLTTYGGYNQYEFTEFNVNLQLNKDGNDLITLSVKDREGNHLSNASTTEAASVTISAELIDAIEYVSFETDIHHGIAAITDVEITGAALPELTESVYPEGVVAEDTLNLEAGYNDDAWEAMQGIVLTSKYDESVLTGTGFAANWSTSPTEFVQTDSKIQTYFYQKSNVIRLNNSSAEIYRQLSTPVATADREASYTYTFTTHEGNSQYSARGGVDAYIGDGITVGYDWTEDLSAREGYTLTDNEGLITPYIEIDGVRFTNGALVTHANDTCGEMVTFTTKIDLTEGHDVITLTVQDREGNNHANADTDEVVTIKAVADIADDIDYIGFGGVTKLDLCDISLSGIDYSAVEAMYAQNVFIIAEDTLQTDEGYVAVTADTLVSSGDIYEDENPGTGWAGKWMAKESDSDTYREITETDNLKYVRQQFWPTAADKTAGINSKFMHLFRASNTPKTVGYYRELSAPVDFDIDGKTVFEVDVREDTTTATARNPFRYYVDDLFYVGHDRDETGEYIYPLIGFAGEDGVFNTSDDIITKSEKSLLTGGGDSYGEYVTYTVTVLTDADGADYIELYVKDREQYHGSFTHWNTESVTIATSALLSGKCSHIGVGTTDTCSFAARLMNFRVSGIAIADTSAVEAEALALVASDAIDKYSYPLSGNVAAGYVSGTNPGVGFANGWSSTADTFTAPVDDDKIIGYNTSLYATSDATAATFAMIKLEGTGVTAYRQLAEPITLSDECDEVYTFAIDVMDGISAAANRINYKFAYHIGDGIKVGYNRNSDGTKIIPYIEINGEITNADKEYNMAGGENGDGEFVTFNVKLVNSAKGVDKVVLTVQDRATNQKSWDNYDAEEILTVEVKANITGNEISYIGAGAPSSDTLTSVRIQNIEIKGTTADKFDEINNSYVVDIASENFASGYETTGALASAYGDGVTQTGSGWSSLWSTSATEYVAPVSTDKAEYYIFSSIKTIRFNDAPSGTRLYRPLTYPVSFGEEQDNKFVFEVDMMDGITTATARRPFRYFVGDAFYAGYDRDSSGENVYALIGFAGADGIFDTDDDVIYTSADAAAFAGGEASKEFGVLNVTVLTDADGIDCITATFTTTETSSVSVMADLSGKTVSFIGVGAGYSKSPNFRFREFSVTGSSFDRSASEAIANANMEYMSKGYEGARVLNTITDEYARELLMAEFNKYGYAYEDFDGYTEYETSVAMTPSYLDGGAGWNGAWAGSNIQLRDDTKKGIVLRGETPALNLSRTLANPIDLSVDGEYYVKVTAYVDATSDTGVNKHNFVIALGDIVAGTKGVNDDSIASGTDANCKITPVFGTDGTANTVSEDVYMSGRSYNSYVIRIVSSAAEADTVEFFVSTDGVLGDTSKYATASIESDAVIDTISMTNGVSAIKLDHVSVDCWNDSITVKDISDYDTIDASGYLYYSDYEAAVGNAELTECVTTDYYTAQTGFLGIIPSYKLETGLVGSVYTEIDDISDLALYADIRNVRVSVPYENTGVYDKTEDGTGYKDHYAVLNLTGFYYDGKLMKVKRFGAQVKTTEVYTGVVYNYDFPTSDGWPEELDYTKLEIKVFSFTYHTFAPLDYVHSFANSKIAPAEGDPLVIFVNSAYNTDNGASDGTSAAPYTTLEEANDAIEAMIEADEYPAGGVTVKTEGNFTYPLSARFNPTVSGNYNAPVVFEGVNDAKIIGGITLDLSQFTAVGEGDAVTAAGVVKYTVPTDVYTFDMDYPLGGHARSYNESLWAEKTGSSANLGYYNLFFENEMQTLARWPNSGFAYVKDVISYQNIMAETTDSDYGTAGMEFSISETSGGEAVDTSRWKNDPDLVVHGYFSVDFSDLETPASINENGYILTDYNCGKNPTLNSGSRRVIVKNSPDELDSEGEWYIDTEENTVYFMPPAGVTSGQIIIGTNKEAVVRTSGSSYVTIKNFDIVGGRNQAMSVNNGYGMVVDGCTITGSGGYGIFTSGLRNSSITNNTVSYTGRGGISVSGGSTSSDSRGNNVVENNIIHDYSERSWTYSPAISLGGYGNTATRNTIYNSPHMAISFTGNDNTVSYNEIYDVLKETSDMGAIYGGKNKSNRGNVIEYNYFHDLKSDSVLSGGDDIMAIFMDDIMDGYKIHNNVFENITGGAFRANGGRLADIQNNVFINVSAYNASLVRHSQVEDDVKKITVDGALTDNPSYNRYYDFLDEDSVVATLLTGGEVPAVYEKYPHFTDLATDSPLEPKYNVFKNNYTFPAKTYDLKLRANSCLDKDGNAVTFGDNVTLSNDTLRSYMTTVLECDFVDSTSLTEAPSSYTQYIGIELSDIGASHE